MLSFEQAQELLTQFADEIPPEIYRELGGGILLLPELKYHPKGVGKDLYILGQYHYDPWGLGRYITIYYESFIRVHGGLPDALQAEKLRKLLFHELTHHLEHLAGDKALELQDDIDIRRYLEKKEGIFIEPPDKKEKRTGE